MPMAPAVLASDLAKVVSPGKPPSAPTLGEATSIIQWLIQYALVSHAVVSGTTAAATPLAAGAAAGGKILGLAGPALAQLFVTNGVAPAPTKEIMARANALATHILSAALVTFQPGGIVGQCTSSPTAPGPLLLGAGTGGRIAGLSADGLAQLASSAYGSVSPQLKQQCEVIVTHIQTNALVTYPPGTVIGVCPPAAGPLVATATGGKLS